MGPTVVSGSRGWEMGWELGVTELKEQLTGHESSEVRPTRFARDECEDRYGAVASVRVVCG